MLKSLSVRRDARRFFLQLLNFVARFIGSEVGIKFGVPLLHRVVMITLIICGWNRTVLMLVPPSQLTSESAQLRFTGRHIQVTRTKTSAAQLFCICMSRDIGYWRNLYLLRNAQSSIGGSLKSLSLFELPLFIRLSAVRGAKCLFYAM